MGVTIDITGVNALPERTANATATLMRDILEGLGFCGRWHLKFQRQVRSRGGIPRLLVRGLDNRAIILIVRPRGNDSRWQCRLTPPEGVSPSDVCDKLRLVDREGSVPQVVVPAAGDAVVVPSVSVKVAPQLPASNGSGLHPPRDQDHSRASRVAAQARQLGLCRPAYVGEGLYCIAAMINPEQALVWLTEYNTRNRRLAKRAWQRYVRDLLTKRWRIHHQGIAFDEEGKLLDGQHRLYAIVEANEPALLVVFLNVPQVGKLGIDQMRARTLQDVADVTDHQWIKREASTLRTVMLGGRVLSHTQFSHQEILEFSERHKVAFLWMVRQFGRQPKVRGVSVAPVKAAVMCAFYHVDLGKLARFVEVLHNCAGARENEGAAVALDRALRSLIGRRGAGKTREDQFFKATRAIAAFANGVSLSLLRPDKELRFRLPDDPSARVQELRALGLLTPEDLGEEG